MKDNRTAARLVAGIVVVVGMFVGAALTAPAQASDVHSAGGKTSARVLSDTGWD
jgi:hypothetical protein